MAHAMPSGGQLATRLPGALTARAFGPAWVLALAAHVMIAAVVLLAPVHTEPEAPLVRLVYLEPPPPPPAPLGAPAGGGTVAAQPAEPPAEVVPERPKKRAKPVVPDATRLRRARVQKKAKPAPKSEPKPEPRVEARAEVSEPVAVAPGIAAGAVNGQSDGAVGGVEGGLAGGIVGGTGTSPIPLGEVAHRPQLIHRVDPLYPKHVRQRDLQGLVLLEAILDREGRVEPAVKILKSIPMLDAEAVAAVRQWRFQPARNRAGEAVRVVLQIPIRFTLR